MASQTFLYPASYSCDFNNSFTRSRLIPKVQNCVDVPCGWVTDYNDLWHFSKCKTDKDFTIPYQAGDLITLQATLTDTWNTDPENPSESFTGATGTPAFRVQLLDCDGNLISSDITTFTSRYLVGWNGEKSVQMWTMDTALIKSTYGLTCWSVRLNSFIDVGGVPTENRAIYFEPFCEIKCKDLPILQSLWPKYDCCGNYYGTFTAFAGSGAFTYDNSLRFFANLLDTGSAITKNEFENNVTKTQVVDLYELQLTEAIPPYLKKIFSNVYYSAPDVRIDGTSYKSSGNVSNRLDRTTQMFLFDAEFTQDCEQKFYCE